MPLWARSQTTLYTRSIDYAIKARNGATRASSSKAPLQGTRHPYPGSTTNTRAPTHASSLESKHPGHMYSARPKPAGSPTAKFTRTRTWPTSPPAASGHRENAAPATPCCRQHPQTPLHQSNGLGDPWRIVETLSMGSGSRDLGKECNPTSVPQQRRCLISSFERLR